MKKPEKQKEVVGHKKSNNSSVEDIRNKISNVINNPPPTFTPLPTNGEKEMGRWGLRRGDFINGAFERVLMAEENKRII